MGTFCQQETESDLQSGKGNSRVNYMFNVVSIKKITFIGTSMGLC